MKHGTKKMTAPILTPGELKDAFMVLMQFAMCKLGPTHIEWTDMEATSQVLLREKYEQYQAELDKELKASPLEAILTSGSNDDILRSIRLLQGAMTTDEEAPEGGRC